MNNNRRTYQINKLIMPEEQESELKKQESK
jgi:hypothetical protein